MGGFALPWVGELQLRPMPKAVAQQAHKDNLIAKLYKLDSTFYVEIIDNRGSKFRFCHCTFDKAPTTADLLEVLGKAFNE